jgi:hypothetical protein
MPCCAIALLALFGPRLILFGIWLFNNPYLQRATDNWLLQCFGFFFLPWTLLAYAFSINTFGAGQFAGLDGTGLALTLVGFIIDLVSYGGSGYGNRDRIRSYTSH